MNNNLSKIIYWLPRVISLLFIVFLSLFAFDVFNEYSGWGAVLPLVMHLLPSLILLVLTIIAWKYDLVGAVVFISLAIFYVIMVGFGRPWSWYASISGPALVVGVLFLLNWLPKKVSQ